MFVTWIGRLLYLILPAITIGMIAFFAVFMFHFSTAAWFSAIGWMMAGSLLRRFYAFSGEREAVATPVVLHQRPAALPACRAIDQTFSD